MANLKEVRSRITSVQSTRQITSAMKMVSAAKLKRAQDAIVQFRPYAGKLQSILSNVAATLDTSDSPYGEQREVKKTLLVVFTSNRGLCGGFNANVIKASRSYIERHSNEEVHVFPIGKRARDYFKKTPFMQEFGMENAGIEIFDHLDFESSCRISQSIMDAFVSKQYDQVKLVYNQFKNAAVQFTEEELLLPMRPVEGEAGAGMREYLYNPNKAEIVKDLIPKSLHLQVYKALLDSHASEHGARMTAMHKATENASDLLRDLKLAYNKARQAAITNEILEISAGAEALND